MPFKLTLAAKVPPNSGSFFVPVVLSVSTGAEFHKVCCCGWCCDYSDCRCCRCWLPVVGSWLLVVVCRRLSLVVVGCGCSCFCPTNKHSICNVFCSFCSQAFVGALALACFSYGIAFPAANPTRTTERSNQGTQNLANATQNGLNVNIPPTAMLRSRARKVDPPLHRKPSSRNVNTPHAKNSSVVSHWPPVQLQRTNPAVA